jgi:hypothetical protein
MHQARVVPVGLGDGYFQLIAFFRKPYLEGNGGWVKPVRGIAAGFHYRPSRQVRHKRGCGAFFLKQILPGISGCKIIHKNSHDIDNYYHIHLFMKINVFLMRIIVDSCLRSADNINIGNKLY